MSGNSLLLSSGDEFRAVQPVADPFGFHFAVCNFLAVPLDQQLSVLHLKKSQDYLVCASYFIEITSSYVLL